MNSFSLRKKTWEKKLNKFMNTVVDLSVKINLREKEVKKK